MQSVDASGGRQGVRQGVRPAGRVLQEWPAAQCSRHRRSSAEGVQSFDVEPSPREGSERGPDVVADVALISPSGRRIDIEDLNPSVEQLADGGSGARIALLVDLVIGRARTLSA